MKLSKTQLNVLRKLNAEGSYLWRDEFTKLWCKGEPAPYHLRDSTVTPLVNAGLLHAIMDEGATNLYERCTITPAGRAALADGRKETGE